MYGGATKTQRRPRSRPCGAVLTLSSTSVGRQPKTQVVALHGGPAFTHNYMLPLMLLADEGHPVVFYDQAGCGGSRGGFSSAKDEAP